MRPLDRLSSIKTKLGVVIVGAVAVTLVVNEIGLRMNVKPLTRAVVAGALGLAMVQFLARGMTSPLREMAAAARQMARGDYSRRVRATSRDEVGDLARAFNAMSADLAAVDRFRRDLVANVSHELRTPISALRAALENVVDGVERPDPEVLRTMLRQVERLGRLVEQLLDLSRLEAGVVPLDRRPFALRPVLEDAVAEARLRRAEVDLRLSVSGEDLVVDGDPERVLQVVANLVENAQRHSPSGATIDVSARRDGRHTIIEVADEGPGIPPEDAQRVFDRFYRADTARSSSEGGAGLGLAIAKWIVDLHGGHIEPQRRQPHGCRFVVVLPGGEHDRFAAATS